FYFLLVCFSAVYLNHHYLLDLLVGYTDALLVMAAFRLSLGPVVPASEPSAEPEPDRVPA
ncbi:MAG: hypothetical protein ACJ79Y_15595, partial [Myxococcales bacterium]